LTTTRLVLPIAALGLLALAGCGSSSSDSADKTPSPATTTATSPAPAQTTNSAPTQDATADATADLKKAVKAYSDAFLTGDTTAYDMLSKRCRARTDKNEFIGGLMAAKSTYGSALDFKSFSADISGSMARVTYTYDVPAINQDAEPWVREGGVWHEDDC